MVRHLAGNSHEIRVSLNRNGGYRAISTDNRDPFGGARDGGIKPPLPMVLKRKALVEEHDIVPLRTLGLMNGENITEIKGIKASAQRPSRIAVRVFEH